ncbi:hypothetical protein SELR_12700 [Selenomonas ruminantium subsp. lactilytica TAM6421]|uniref:Immunity protein Imm1 n=1 Tax=Selenomonas ruminantium subsp. lactilytica (strain NBRC 103574 / TAM6421) TaxID=927704 RepID=I0GQE1_SELRL|nr:hypothetical protein [Selenomonas ruminantium]BAL82978.1 hypothetical protein SELR_12700 [Selenomonas ruminantium subsp. lactilytica TAM6421]
MKLDIAKLREPMRIVYDIQGKGILRSPKYVEISNPSLERLLAIIELLDGENTTEVSLECEEAGKCMIIGGGNQGLYNVMYIEEFGERNYTLLKEGYEEGKVHKLVCGGQLAEFEDEICVDIDMVKETVEYYYREQGLHNEKYWKLE